MQTKFMAAINQLAAEKNLPKDRVLDIITHALRAAYRKDYGNREQNIKVVLDEDTANATIFLLKEVIADDQELEFPERQMYVTEAKQYAKDPQVGDEVEIDVTPADYGRIAAQSAKQVIIQRIQEAEKDIITDMYKDREHEILNGYVNRVEGPNVYVDLDRTQAILRPQDQIPREHYHNGQRIKVYLDKVVSSPKGPRLLISRSHPKLVNCLLEQEIPEIREGVVTINSVAREAGVRSKVSVSSSDPNVDPIGACVGQKGVRIQNIMEEFNGERIDIIEHSDDELVMLTAALAPAKIAHIDLDEETRRARVYVPVDERAMAIGKGGQNVRLASMLTNWEIDIIDLDKLDMSEFDEEKQKQIERALKGESDEPAKKEAAKKVEMPVAAEDIKDLPGMDPDVAAKLEAAGFVKSIQLMGLNAEAMTAIEGITQEEGELVERALKGEAGEKEEEKESEETKEMKEEQEEEVKDEKDSNDDEEEEKTDEVDAPEETGEEEEKSEETEEMKEEQEEEKQENEEEVKEESSEEEAKEEEKSEEA